MQAARYGISGSNLPSLYVTEPTAFVKSFADTGPVTMLPMPLLNVIELHIM